MYVGCRILHKIDYVAAYHVVRSWDSLCLNLIEYHQLPNMISYNEYIYTQIVSAMHGGLPSS